MLLVSIFYNFCAVMFKTSRAGLRSSLPFNFSYPQQNEKRVDKFEKSDQSLPKPYIQLKARLSQVWINPWTVFLILLIVRLLLVTQDLHMNLDRVSQDLDTGCTALEASASTAVSMPHYLAKGTNKLVQTTIEAAVHGLSTLTVEFLVAVEALVIFFVNAFKATYLCLLELAVTGSLTAVLDAVEVVGDFVNSTLIGISSDIATGIADVNTVIQGLTDVVTKAAALLGETITLPSLSVPQISELQGLSIPTSFDTELDTLKNALNLDSVQGATDDAIRIPFEKLQTLVNDSLSAYTFDGSLLTVPATEKVTFCAESGLGNTLQILEDAVIKTYHGIIALLALAALLSIVIYAYLEWWKWRSLKSRAELVKEVSTDPIDLVLFASSPLQGRVGLKLQSKFESQRNKNLTRWFIGYITHQPLNLVLLLAVAGLLACALQAIMLKALTDQAPSAASDAAKLSELVYNKLANASDTWANQTNTQIVATQTQINHDLFGWVETSTTAVNDTLVAFTDTLVGTLNTTFGGTILYTPILKVLDCIILLKVQGIESGLTWVHDRAHVTFPQVSGATLMLDQTDSEALFPNISSTVSGQSETAIKKVADYWRASIRQEAIISGCLALIWLLFVLLGLSRCLFIGMMQHRRAFRGCMVKDVKQCISRPKQNETEQDDGAQNQVQKTPLPVIHEDEEQELYMRIDQVPRLAEPSHHQSLRASFLDTNTFFGIQR